MFTIKLYCGSRIRILSAESFTILGNPIDGWEITLHQKNQSDDVRYDIGDASLKRDSSMPILFESAIIENSQGKTTQILRCNQSSSPGLAV